MKLYMIMNRNSGKNPSRQETHVNASDNAPIFYTDKATAESDAKYWNGIYSDDNFEVVEMVHRY